MGCHTWTYKPLKVQPTEQDKIACFQKDAQHMMSAISMVIDGTYWDTFGEMNKSLEQLKETQSFYPYNSIDDAEKAFHDWKWFYENSEKYKQYKHCVQDDINNKVPVFSRESELYQMVMNWKAPVDNDSKCDYSDSQVDELTIFDEQTGLYYTSVRRYNDMFRYYDYEQDNIHSLQETLELIKTNSTKAELYDDSMDKINEFWREYPDGLIQFG
jgi:hypothetical protein